MPLGEDSTCRVCRGVLACEVSGGVFLINLGPGCLSRISRHRPRRGAQATSDGFLNVGTYHYMFDIVMAKEYWIGFPNILLRIADIHVGPV